MANCSYLVVSDCPRIHPSFDNPNFNPGSDTIATCADGVPLMWLELFRPEDLSEAEFTPDGETVAAFAPLTTVDRARAQVVAGAQRLGELFEHPAVFSDYGAWMLENLQGGTGSNITIELEEIACLHEEGTFRSVLERVLRYLAGDTGDETLSDDVLRVVVGLDPESIVWPAPDDDSSPEHEEILAHMFGCWAGRLATGRSARSSLSRLLNRVIAMAKFTSLRIRVGTKYKTRLKIPRKVVSEVSRIVLWWDQGQEWSVQIACVIVGDNEPTFCNLKEFAEAFNAKDGFAVVAE